MRPGQVALEIGAIAALSEGFEGQLAARVMPTFHEAWGAMLLLGAQLGESGRPSLRDAILAAEWRPVREDIVAVTVRPGLSLPLGGLAEGLEFTPLSTSSIDPWLAADLVVGGTWAAVLTAQARVPVYAGWDGFVQGPFVRVDLRGAVRAGKAVAWAGLSTVRGDDVGVFVEVAAVAGATWNLDPRWALSASLRVPVATTARRTYVGAALVSARYVAGRKKEAPTDH